MSGAGVPPPGALDVEERPPAVVVKLTEVDTSDPDVVRIHRGTPWGNPFVIGRDGDRAEVIARYRRYLFGERPDLVARLDELRGMRLACWCAPKPCHGDVLVAELVARDAGPPVHGCAGHVCRVPHCDGDGPRVDPVAEGWADLVVACSTCGRTSLSDPCSSCRAVAAGARWLDAYPPPAPVAAAAPPPRVRRPRRRVLYVVGSGRCPVPGCDRESSTNRRKPEGPGWWRVCDEHAH